tara:strand:+ start:423 stop:743 length:321 start_codon:yes stop_codon:yes gene_type:complete
MNDQLFSSLGAINRMQYFSRTLILIALPFLVTVISLNFFSHWHDGTHFPLGVFIGLMSALFAIFGILMQSIKRLNDLSVAPIWSVLLVMPFVNVIFILFLILLPSK